MPLIVFFKHAYSGAQRTIVHMRRFVEKTKDLMENVGRKRHPQVPIEMLVCCSNWRYSLTNYLTEYTYLHMLLKLKVNLGITEVGR